MAIAKHFDDLGRAKDAQVARADATRLYDQLLSDNSDQNGPLLAPAMIQALGSIGVDFSVQESDLRDWPANPRFTPYQAISHALLLLGRRLKSPVFLDVIVFNYEHTRHVASPRNLKAVKLDILKTAILDGFNERYGTRLGAFDEVLN